MLNSKNKIMSTKLKRQLTKGQIRQKIEAGDSFWVGTVCERAEALNHALALRLNCTSKADARGGFSVWSLTPPPIG